MNSVTLKNKNINVQLLVKILRKYDSIRISSSLVVSVLIHIFVITSFWGIKKLDKPVEPPIRQINFIDFTEENAQAKKSNINHAKIVVNKAEKSTAKITNNEENIVATNQQTITLQKDKRLIFDKPRKQAPINIERHAAVVNKINAGQNVLKISPAKGLDNKKSNLNAFKINLNKQKKIVLASGKPNNNNFKVTNKHKPEIKLDNKKLLTNNKASNSKYNPKPVKLKKSFTKLKQTETSISGPLANRKIISKKVPAFPVWAKRQGVGATISLRFTVMENGIVKENIIIERTSGSKDWDQLVMASLKEWKFAESNKTGVRYDQTGVITFQFVI